jgi:hypothetical protein
MAMFARKLVEQGGANSIIATNLTIGESFGVQPPDLDEVDLRLSAASRPTAERAASSQRSYNGTAGSARAGQMIYLIFRCDDKKEPLRGRVQRTAD